MSNEGWIKLYRKIRENCLWQMEPCDKCRAFIDILMKAVWKDTTLIIRGNPQVVKRGSFRTSIGALGKEWGWSDNKVKRFLKLLVKLEMITTKGDADGTVINIVNYNEYQADEPTDEPSDEPAGSRTDGGTNVGADALQKKKRNNSKRIKEKKNSFDCYDNKRNIDFAALEEQLLKKQ